MTALLIAREYALDDSVEGVEGVEVAVAGACSVHTDEDEPT